MAREAIDHVGFALGEDAQRAVQSIGQDLEKLDKIARRKGGLGDLFETKQLTSYQRAMGMLGRHVRRLEQGHQQLNRKIQHTERAYKSSLKAAQDLRKELEAAEKAGEKVSAKQRRRLGNLQAAAQGHKATLAPMHAQATQERQQLRTVRLEQGRRRREQDRIARRSQRRKRVGLALAGGGTAFAGWMVNSIRKGMGTLMENQLARGDTYSLDPRARGGFGSVERYGMRMGLTPAEAQARYQASLRSSGKARAMDVRSNIAMERGFGVNMGTLGGYQTQARHAGGAQFAQDLNKAALQGFRTGGYARPLMDEFISSATDYIGSIQGSREKVSAGQTMGLIGLLSRRLGGVYKDSPQRTTQVLKGLHGTISQPGGGEAGQAFMLRSQSFGQPGGRSYVAALEQLEKGATPENIKRMMQQIQKEYGGESLETRMLLLNRLSGGRVKLHQARKLFGINTDDLNSQTVAKAMHATTGPSAGKAAGKAAGYTGIRQMLIGMDQELAKLAGTSLPQVRAAFALQKKAIQTAAKVMGGLNNTIDYTKNKIKELGKAADSTTKKLFKATTGIQLDGPKRFEDPKVYKKIIQAGQPTYEHRKTGVVYDAKGEIVFDPRPGR